MQETWYTQGVMGACLSCLGFRSSDGYEADRSRLLLDEAYAQNNQSYGTWGSSNIPPQNVMNPEEARREQEALDNITRWASDQIVEIFPHNQPSITTSVSQIDGTSDNPNALRSHHDILLSMIPGDKSKRSIRIYPASRPSSKDTHSMGSKGSSGRLNGSTRGKGTGVFVKLKVDLP